MIRPFPLPPNLYLKQVKSAELLSEHTEFALLSRWLDRNPRPATAGASPIADVLRRVVAFSARQSGYPDEALDASRIKDALNTLASALA